jgi:hypothetical protein
MRPEIRRQEHVAFVRAGHARRLEGAHRAQLDAQGQRWIARSYRTMGTHGLTKVRR